MKSRNRPPRIPVTMSKLEEHFAAQISFLRKSSDEYDLGDKNEYRRLATHMRVLFYNNPPNAHSLLNQIGLHGEPFFSSNYGWAPGNLLADMPLTGLLNSPTGIQIVPLCSTPLDPNRPPRSLSFDEWWSEPVLRSNDGEIFTRRQIVLIVANQDGGAHVDPEIEETYHKITRGEAIGLTFVSPFGEYPLENIEKAYIRQIAWESIQSLETAWNRMLGNRACLCGCGRKARYCAKSDSAHRAQAPSSGGAAMSSRFLAAPEPDKK